MPTFRSHMLKKYFRIPVGFNDLQSFKFVYQIYSSSKTDWITYVYIIYESKKEFLNKFSFLFTYVLWDSKLCSIYLHMITNIRYDNAYDDKTYHWRIMGFYIDFISRFLWLISAYIRGTIYIKCITLWSYRWRQTIFWIETSRRLISDQYQQ